MTLRRAVILSSIAGACALVPWLVLFCMHHGPFTVPPEFVDDSEYYYARLTTIASGHPFIGNPYFKEYSEEMASAFFGADWLAAVPLVAHVPLIPAILLDLFFWSGIYTLLSLWLLTLFGVSGKNIGYGGAALFLSAFWLLERPVAMQIVFPSYLVFLASVLWWLQRPRSYLRTLILAVSATLTFYIYTYLWQIVTVTLLALHALFVLRERAQYRTLLLVDAFVALLVAPMVWYTYTQLTHPWYWETVTRIGFIPTHTFGSAALVNGALIILTVVAFYLVTSAPLRHASSVWVMATGLALMGTTFSNVITGKDLETAVHIGRFVEVWAVAVALIVLHEWRPARRTLRSYGAASIAFLVLVSAGYSFFHGWRGVTDDALLGERYAPTLSWLAANTPPGSVILADDSFSHYVPILTHDFVLFDSNGELYLMPDSAVEDRYLASRIFSDLTVEQIQQDYRKYAGVGNAVHHFKVHNREVALCRMVVRSGCGTTVPDALADRGSAYFEELYRRYEIMKSHPLETLKRFGVTYLVVGNNEKLRMEGLVETASIGSTTVYSVH